MNLCIQTLFTGRVAKACTTDGHNGNTAPVQIAFQVRDIAEARRFYREILGCLESRSEEQVLLFNLHGHQIACHLNPRMGKYGRVFASDDLVHETYVPVSQCGVVLDAAQWRALMKRLKHHRVKFVIESNLAAKDAPRAQAALLFLDPSGNALRIHTSLRSARELAGTERQRGVAWAFLAILAAIVAVCALLLAGK